MPVSNAACRPKVFETNRQREGASGPPGPAGHNHEGAHWAESPMETPTRILRINHVPLGGREETGTCFWDCPPGPRPAEMSHCPPPMALRSPSLA